VQTKKSKVIKLLTQFGPGLAVMLADTEAGSVITAAQSGARWGYRLLLLQALIVPLLFMVQELAARLALGTGQGYVELIRQRFGKMMAVVSVTTLAVSCFGTLVTELGGLASVGQIFGVPIWQTIAALIVLILTMVTTGAYQSVERIVILSGLFELAFLVIAWKARPDHREVMQQLLQMPIGNHDYLYLLAANLGTSIMPWSIFYQQSALLDKGLGLENVKAVRAEIMVGAILCQVITAAIMIAAAASFSHNPSAMGLENVTQIADAFGTSLGMSWGHIIFCIGLSGGALIATVLVCLTAAWAFGEVTGIHHSLEQRPLDAPWFYVAFAAMLILGGLVVISGVSLVRLSIAMGVLNALLLPIALGFLYALARSELRGTLQLNGVYGKLIAMTFCATSILGVYCAIAGM
jgi:Mn2+/Fe2+ NRAMP family transporter